jgi:hypothetical protein
MGKEQASPLVEVYVRWRALSRRPENEISALQQTTYHQLVIGSEQKCDGRPGPIRSTRERVRLLGSVFKGRHLPRPLPMGVSTTVIPIPRRGKRYYKQAISAEAENQRSLHFAQDCSSCQGFMTTLMHPSFRSLNFLYRSGPSFSEARSVMTNDGSISPASIRASSFGR